MSNNDSFSCTSKFYGLDYFPYGIHRCGEFSKKEADLLEKHGMAYQAIHKEAMKPRNAEEEQFLEVCKKQRLPETEHEKTWIKFLKKTRRSAVSAFGGSPAANVKIEDSFGEDWD